MRLSVRPQEALSDYLAARSRGRAEVLVVAHDLEAVAAVLRDCRAVDWPVRFLGSGTRVIAPDGLMTGVVLKLGTSFDFLHRQGEALHLGAALPLPALAEALAELGSPFAEWAGARGGSVGASLALDEGWPAGTLVEVLHRGQVQSFPVEAIRGKARLVLGAYLRAPDGDAKRARRRLDQAWSNGKLGRPGSRWRLEGSGDVRAVLKQAALQQVRLRGHLLPTLAPELLVCTGPGSAADAAHLLRSATERVRRLRALELVETSVWWAER